MADISLAVENRDGAGKGASRRLRASGKVPAILYGLGKQPVSLVLDPRKLEHILSHSEAGLNTILALDGPGGLKGRMVMVKTLQREPVRGSMLHADLLEVDPNRKVHVSVRLHVVGTPKGVALSGGILDQALREIELECLPRAIPDELTVDVSDLDIGGSVHVRDVKLPEGVTLKTDGDLSVASVTIVKAEVEAAPVVAPTPEAAAAAAAAPAAAATPKPEG